MDETYGITGSGVDRHRTTNTADFTYTRDLEPSESEGQKVER